MLKSPSGKIYIGQTIRPIEKRFKQHRKKSSGCRAIYNAIKMYGWENFEKDWYECPDEDLNFDEELLIREMKTLAPKGYNLKKGGYSGGEWSEESKRKLSESLRGKTLTEETKQKISESMSGENNPNFGKTGENSHMFGKTHNEGTKQKMSKSQRKRTMSEESKQKIRESMSGEKNHQSRRVYQYTPDGIFMCSFGTAEEAAQCLDKKTTSSISACARGVPKYKTAYGFKWSYIKI